MITAISRGVTFVGVSLKNILYFCLFIGVILFLFFIPEILKFDWVGFTGVSIKAPVVQTVSVEVSPLDELIQRIDSGYYSQARGKAGEGTDAKAQPQVEQAKPAEPALPPFNPHMKIKKLKILKVVSRARSQAGKPATTHLQMTGTVEGADIKKIDLLIDGNYSGRVPFDRPNSEGKREFFISKPNAASEWTIRVEDKNKRVYEKTYRFFPAIERYPLSNDTFQVRHDATGLDPRIEKMFTISEQVPGQRDTKGFVEF